jgi:hypothetical protein
VLSAPAGGKLLPHRGLSNYVASRLLAEIFARVSFDLHFGNSLRNLDFENHKAAPVMNYQFSM